MDLAIVMVGVWSCDKASGPELARVSVVLAVDQLEQGDTTRAEVIVRDWRAHRADTTRVTFASSNVNVLRVSAGGLVTALRPGTSTISADVDGIVGEASLTVNLTVGAVALTTPASAFDVGDSLLATPTVTSIRGLPVTGRAVTYSSSNAAIATVTAGGYVRGTGVGTATITATVDGKSGSAPFTIQYRPASLQITPANPRLNATDTVQLSAVALDSSGNVLPGRTTVWTTADGNRVSVTSSGRAAWIGPGRATVTARSGSAVATTVVSTAGDLAITGVTITQAVQDSLGTIPLVTNSRPAAVLVLLRTDVPTPVATDVALRLYDAQGNVTFTASAQSSQPISPTPSLTQPSVQILLPAEQIKAGLKWRVVRQASGFAQDDSAVTDSFPSGGAVNLPVTGVPPLNVKFIPITLSAHGGTTPTLTQNEVPGYMQTLQSNLPLGRINPFIGSAMSTSVSFGTAPVGGVQTFWPAVLQELNAARLAGESDPTMYWYGVVSPPAGFTSLTNGGIAYVPLNPQSTGSGTHTALGVRTGWAFQAAYARDMVAHELGHNFGRRHAPCGNPAGPDPNFPQADGTIGRVMHDVETWSANTLAAIPSIPANIGDIMSYCSPKWLSAYTYQGILNGRGIVAAGEGAVIAATLPLAATDLVVIQGSVRLDGSEPPVLLPALAIRGRPALPDSGGHRLQGFDAAGALLVDYPFGPTAVDHVPDLGLFTFGLPRDATVQRLARVRVVGPGGVTIVDDATAPFTGAPSVARTGADLTASCGDPTARVALQDDATGALLGIGTAGTITARSAATNVSVSCARAVRTDRRAFVLR